MHFLLNLHVVFFVINTSSNLLTLGAALTSIYDTSQRITECRLILK